MSVLKKFRKTIEVTVDGEKIPVTVRKLGTADILEIANRLPTVYQQMVDTVGDDEGFKLEVEATAGMEIVRALLHKGVIDPPICDKPGPDCITISELEDTRAETPEGRFKPVMDILEAISEISDLEGLFRSPKRKSGTKAKTKKPTRSSS